MNTFTVDEAREQAIAYFGNELSADVFINKYALRNNQGEYLETIPDQMHDRLAKEFARIDSEKYGFDYEERFTLYRNAMHKFGRIVPQGSPMAAIGNTLQIMSASNCVVVESPRDSMGGIVDSGKELAELMKRRCVEENTLVHTMEEGPIPIKSVKVGMHVLSFDIDQKITRFKRVKDKFKTDVKKEDRVELIFSSGARLKTSRKHPVLLFENGKYTYKNAGELQEGDVGIRPESRPGSFLFRDIPDLLELGWFIGAHMGDGSVDKVIRKNKKAYGNYAYNRTRFRILGDNEVVVSKYKDIFNKLSNSNSTYHASSRKDYKTTCWEYTNANVSNNSILNKYLDGQSGSKTYSGFTPSFIKEEKLWWAYLGGLIDADGHVKNNGEAISLRLCAQSIIDDLAAFLSSQGVSLRTSIIPPRKENEAVAYELYIHGDTKLWEFLRRFIFHPKKSAALTREVRAFSHTKTISQQEYFDIEDSYRQSPLPKVGNFSACMKLLRQRDSKRLGLGGLNEFVSKGIISTTKKNEIYQRVELKEIVDDLQSSNYYDIEVEGTNNFYAGNFGLVNIHNCGVGIDISTLRPTGTAVNNAARTTSGAWSFADFFSYITQMVGQEGRRGALMVTIDVHHPDVVAFAKMKTDLDKANGANVSVRLSNEFLQAVVDDVDYEQRWPCEGKAAVSKQVRARDVWDAIIEYATKSAEPGLIMWDRMVEQLPAHYYPDFQTISTNPCAEIALSAYDSCRLISLNLTGYVRNAFEKHALFDFDMFESDVALAMQMADNLVDIELELVNKIMDICSEKATEAEESLQDESLSNRDRSRLEGLLNDALFERKLWQKLWDAGHKGRRTGLGTHGLADALAQLGCRYDAEETINGTVKKIYERLRNVSYSTSARLSKERGSFPVWDWECDKKCPFIQRLPKKIRDEIQEHGRRNVAILTQAPTGSISMVSKCGEFDLHNVSSGVEPVFRNSYTRRKKINSSDGKSRVDFVDRHGDKWQEYKVFHGNIQSYMNKFGLEDESDLPEYFITSDEIDWMRRIEIQGVEQQFIDHSISSTINLPRGTSKEVVGELYLAAWQEGLKGVTIYVEGSRDGVLLSDDITDDEGRPLTINYVEAPKRHEVLPCEVHHATVKGVKWTVLVGLMDEKPYELFMGYSEQLELPPRCSVGHIVKTEKGRYNLHLHVGEDELVLKDIIKTFDNPESAWATRLISMSLRHGVHVEFVVDQLGKDGKILDLNKVLARILKKYIDEGGRVRSSITCPSCNSHNFIFEEGCPRCMDCGFTKCK